MNIQRGTNVNSGLSAYPLFANVCCSKKNLFSQTSPSWSCLFCNNICVRCLDDRCWSNLPDRWRNHWDRVLMIMGHLAGVGATAVATHVTFMNRPLKQKFLRDTICKAKKIKGCWTLKAKRIRDGDPEGEKLWDELRDDFLKILRKLRDRWTLNDFFYPLYLELSVNVRIFCWS